jgi:hypothetical protein
LVSRVVAEECSHWNKLPSFVRTAYNCTHADNHYLLEEVETISSCHSAFKSSITIVKESHRLVTACNLFMLPESSFQ